MGFKSSQLMDGMRKSGIAESAFMNYKSRLNSIKNYTGKDIFYILLHPKTVYRLLLDWKNITTPASRANYITPVCKLFTSNPDFLERFPKQYETWKAKLHENRVKEKKSYENREPNEKEMNKYVSFEQIKLKLNELGKNPFMDFKTHMQFLLLAFFVYITPKRADLGYIRFYSEMPPKTGDKNFIVLNSRPRLFLFKYKTSKIHNTIVEDIPDELYDILKKSLKHLPRKYLFGYMDGDTFVPYKSNNAYAKFVTRTSMDLFQKPMGVSMFRHVYISEKIDFNNDPIEKRKEVAKKMGHTIRQQEGIYHWVNMRNINKKCETKCMDDKDGNEVCVTTCTRKRA